jgi:hypothetical protein
VNWRFCNCKIPRSSTGWSVGNCVGVSGLVGVIEAVAVAVAVLVADAVRVIVGVSVSVIVCVGIGVGVAVGGVVVAIVSMLAVIPIVGVADELAVATGVAVKVAVNVAIAVGVGVGVWVGAPGKYTPMGCIPGKTAKGLLPGELWSAGTIAGSTGPNGVITTAGVDPPTTGVPCRLAVTTPGASVF